MSSRILNTSHTHEYTRCIRCVIIALDPGAWRFPVNLFREDYKRDGYYIIIIVIIRESD